MFGHLCPVGLPAPPGALAGGLAVADDVVGAGVAEWVDALAMLRPSASVPPSAAAPTAVPASGLLIRTLPSFQVAGRGAGRGESR
jgi:hypothetical protein